MPKHKLTEWHISDFVKSDEDVHALMAAEREPYEKALRLALVVLKEIGELTDQEVQLCDPRYFAKRYSQLIIKQLAKEGIKDPTELKEEKNENNIH